jgi:hypothetical protein
LRNSLLPEESFEVLGHLTPKISISPFGQGSKVSANKPANQSPLLDPKYWLDNGDDITYLKSGRAALHQALIEIGLTKNASVMIVTTSGGRYVSACVTDTIEKICRWSHDYDNMTSAILIIHEFGFPCNIPQKLIDMKLPIIEDCAYAIGTRIEGGGVGEIGDYALYSFSKYFPIPYGGILVSQKRNHEKTPNGRLWLTEEGENFLKCQLENVESKCKDWNEIRKNNWDYFCSNLSPFGLIPFFPSNPKNIPGVFVFKFPKNMIMKGPILKDALIKRGIECTVYYTMWSCYNLTDTLRRHML